MSSPLMDGYLGRYFGHWFLPAALRLTDEPGYRLDYEVGHGGVPLDCHSSQMLQEFRWHPGTQLLSSVAFFGRHRFFAFRFTVLPLYHYTCQVAYFGVTPSLPSRCPPEA